jgi:hypothetical protein
VIARSECLRLVVTSERDLAAQHHDPRVKVVGVQFLGKVRLLTTVHDVETLATQFAFKRFTGERPAIATATR